MTAPAFRVMVTTNYNGNGRLLRWDAPLLPAVHPIQRLIGRYDCFPVFPVAADAPRAKVVELPIAIAEMVLAALCNGIADERCIDSLAAAIRAI